MGEYEMHGLSRRSLRWCGWMLLVLMLAPTVSGCMLFPEEEPMLAPPLVESQTIEFQTVAATLGVIENRLTQTAYFTPALFSTVAFEYSGRLAEIFIREGSVVQEGDVLATLTTEDIDAKIRDQKYAIERLRLRYEEALQQESRDRTVYANADGVVVQLEAKAGDTAEDIQRRYGALGYIVGEESKLTLRINEVPIRLALGTSVWVTKGDRQYYGVVEEAVGGNSVGLWEPLKPGQSPTPTMAWNGTLVVGIKNNGQESPEIGEEHLATLAVTGERLGMGKIEATGGAITAGGEIEEVFVSNGQAVKRGDPLLRIASDTFTSRSISVDLRQAQEVLKGYEEALERSQVIAPISGRVSWIGQFIINDWVNASTSLARISDRDSMVLECKGEKTSQFPLGLPVTIKYKGKEYTGKVSANPESFPRESNGSLNKTARFEIDDFALLVPTIVEGESANVDALLERKENVIVLPKQYIQSFYGRRFVNVLVDGVKEEHDVEIGIETSTMCEITEGVEVGDLIIIR